MYRPAKVCRRAMVYRGYGCRTVLYVKIESSHKDFPAVDSVKHDYIRRVCVMLSSHLVKILRCQTLVLPDIQSFPL